MTRKNPKKPEITGNQQTRKQSICVIKPYVCCDDDKMQMLRKSTNKNYDTNKRTMKPNRTSLKQTEKNHKSNIPNRENNPSSETNKET